MSKNGIAWLPTKEARQLAKLQLAETKRQAAGTAGYRELRYLDTTLLPTVYSGNNVVDNANAGGLQQGRPWKTTPNILAGLWRSVYNGYYGDNGLLAQETDVQWFDTQTPVETVAVTNFTYSMGSSPGDAVSVQWLGYFKAPHTANYVFDATGSDDELYFWIGNSAITGYTAANANVYAYAGSSDRQVSDPISLTADEYYPIRMQWGNSTGGGEVVFGWSDDHVSPFPTYERVEPTGATINIGQTAAFKLDIQSSSFQVNPHVNGQIGIDDIVVIDTSNRGHTVLAMTALGVVIEQNVFDTWGDVNATSAMAATLQNYSTGTVIAICTYDACGLQPSVRSVLNTSYGGTLTDTWAAGRYSHIFIGQKV